MPKIVRKSLRPLVSTTPLPIIPVPEPSEVRVERCDMGTCLDETADCRYCNHAVYAEPKPAEVPLQTPPPFHANLQQSNCPTPNPTVCSTCGGTGRKPLPDQYTPGGYDPGSNYRRGMAQLAQILNGDCPTCSGKGMIS